MKPVKSNLYSGTKLPSFMDDFFGKDLFNWENLNYSDTNTTLPSVNIKETPEEYKVEVAAPGMKKEDFKIELDGNNLSIRSEKSAETTDEKEGKYSRREFSYQSFQRNFNLHRDVMDVENIQAKYENGLLCLTIPKKEEAKQKPPKTISIS